MIVADIVSALGLNLVAGEEHQDAPITGGYASDLLSCVMAGARQGNVWVTLQAHANIIAVADLLSLSCIILSEGTHPAEDTLHRAQEHGIPLLLSTDKTFNIVGKLYQLGIVSD